MSEIENRDAQELLRVLTETVPGGLRQLVDVFNEFMRQVGEALQPLVTAISTMARALFGDVPPDFTDPELFMYASWAGLWSHTVHVCPMFECGSRMRHDPVSHALVCVYGHRFDANDLRHLLGLPERLESSRAALVVSRGTVS